MAVFVAVRENGDTHCFNERNVSSIHLVNRNVFSQNACSLVAVGILEKATIQ
jgi:hypothetical protein